MPRNSHSWRHTGKSRIWKEYCKSGADWWWCDSTSEKILLHWRWPFFYERSFTDIKFVEGKIKVPWRIICESESSPFIGLSGVETFEDGEKDSNIEIKIPQLPRDTKQDIFDIVLSSPSSSTVQTDQSERCSVVVKNNIGEFIKKLSKNFLNIQTLFLLANARLSFAETSRVVNQSEGKLQLRVLREDQLRNEIILPWKVVPQSPDSVYVGIRGERHEKMKQV